MLMRNGPEMNRFQDVTVKHTNNSTLLLMHQIPKTEKYKISQQLLSFQVVTMQKYVFKIILHYSWLESRSNMVIMEVFQGNGTEKKLVLEEKFWYLINFQKRHSESLSMLLSFNTSE